MTRRLLLVPAVVGAIASVEIGESFHITAMTLCSDCGAEHWT